MYVDRSHFPVVSDLLGELRIFTYDRQHNLILYFGSLLRPYEYG